MRVCATNLQLCGIETKEMYMALTFCETSIQVYSAEVPVGEPPYGDRQVEELTCLKSVLSLGAQPWAWDSQPL